MHWIVPTKTKTFEFYRNFARIYYKAYSYKRYIKILLNNFLSILNKFKSKQNKLKHLPLIELILLRIMAFPIRRKLYKQYFRSKIE